MMKIENSARLTFKLMTENDAELFYELDQDPEVMRYINGGNANDMETIKSTSIPRLKAFTDPTKGWGYWQITNKLTDEFIGWVLVRPVGFFEEQKQEDNLEVGWRLKQKFWGKGYATEAAQAVIKELKLQPEIRKLSAFALSNNLGSINIMKKVGMTFISEDTHATPNGQEQVVTYELQV